MASVKGGDKLSLALGKIEKKLKSAKTLKVGFLRDATYPDGTSVAMVAAIQNFGAPKVGIPPRPFFSAMVAKKKKGWPKKLSRLLKTSDYDANKALALLGEGIKGQLQEAIIETDAPALSAVTVMLRGMRSHDQSLVVTGKTVGEAAQRVKDSKTNYGASTKVLSDTGHLLNSVDSEVI